MCYILIYQSYPALQLLGDSNELTQEMASRGLAAVYNRADAATRQALVNALVGTLSGEMGVRRLPPCPRKWMEGMMCTA